MEENFPLHPKDLVEIMEPGYQGPHFRIGFLH